MKEHTSESTSPKIKAKHIPSILPKGIYFFSKKKVIIILATYSKKFATTDLYTLLTAVKYPEMLLEIAIIGRATEIK